MRNERVLSVLLCFFAVPVAGQETRAREVECRISQQAVQRFAEVVFPMEIAGTKKLSGQALGASLMGDVKWTAVVSKPVITLNKSKRRFKAAVTARAAGVTWSGDVEGSLDIRFDAKQSSLVVGVSDTVVPINAGFVTFDLDISEDVPEFVFSVAMPEVTIPEKRQVVRVKAEPAIAFEDGAVVLRTDLGFSVK
jgi:hypothetical protein